MPCGWEGNRRFPVALAMHYRLSGLSTYGLNGLRKGDERPAYVQEGHDTFYLFCASLICLQHMVLYKAL